MLSISVKLLFLSLLLAACGSVAVAPGETVSDLRLAPCPASPNCVSSLAEDEKHQIAPLQCALPATQALARLGAVIESLPGGRVTLVEGNYLKAEFTSKLFKFVDDVEFLVDKSGGKIDVRSASRVGYSDFGANRKRVEEIRRRFAQSD